MRSTITSLATRAIAVGLLALLSPFAVAQPTPQPEAATGFQTLPRAAVTARQHMVVAANPLAAKAGLDILRQGGSALDAAIAVQLVLGLVEPQSSGLGGGAFLVHWDAMKAELTTFDGRETAPAAARPERFVRDGRLLGFGAAVRSGLSVGTPGVVRLMEHAHRRHGKLAWASLFTDAQKLAETGFPVSPRLHGLLRGIEHRDLSLGARQQFFVSDEPRPVGYNLRNPAYARTLQQIAAGGSDAFYRGPIAAEIVEAVRRAPRFPGDLTLEDLAGYEVKERPPVCAPYRGNRVCSMGPPSSGGIALAQTLMLLEGFPLRGNGPAALAAGRIHLAAEALKLAFADRNWYLADPDFVAVPPTLLDPGYIAERRRLISPVRTLAKPYPGLPPGTRTLALGDDDTHEATGTSHISIIDRLGNAVAMTTTIEAGFGSGLWAAGFLLNNQLTDFSRAASDRTGLPVANRVEGGKRPRSSMTPVIVFGPDNHVRVVAGSPGGSRIIPYVVKSLLAVLDGNLDAQTAVALPNFARISGPLEIEAPAFRLKELVGNHRAGATALRTAIGLAPLGQRSVFSELNSGSHVIVRYPDGRLEGGADPRREGIAIGD